MTDSAPIAGLPPVKEVMALLSAVPSRVAFVNDQPQIFVTNDTPTLNLPPGMQCRIGTNPGPGPATAYKWNTSNLEWDPIDWSLRAMTVLVDADFARFKLSKAPLFFSGGSVLPSGNAPPLSLEDWISAHAGDLAGKSGSELKAALDSLITPSCRQR